MTQLWCNGQWLAPQDFPASPTDRGSILGLGLFETVLAIDGRLVFADRHLARLRKSCERLGWNPELPDLREAAEELLVRNALATGRARLRLAVTAGSGRIDELAPGGDSLVWMTAAWINGEVTEAVSANLAPWKRNEHSPLAGLKCASYAENLIALDHARQRGFQQTLFLNTAGHLCEAATANLFLVTDGTLLTPPLSSGCLPGITREVVIELAGGLGIPCEERDLMLETLQSADGAFLTSSVQGITGISRFEDRILGACAVTDRLSRALNEVIARGD
ncbi:MAG TPA: aminotransferase class IV [Luteolibacter sp.]